MDWHFLSCHSFLSHTCWHIPAPLPESLAVPLGPQPLQWNVFHMGWQWLQTNKSMASDPASSFFFWPWHLKLLIFLPGKCSCGCVGCCVRQVLLWPLTCLLHWTLFSLLFLEHPSHKLSLSVPSLLCTLPVHKHLASTHLFQNLSGETLNSSPTARDFHLAFFTLPSLSFKPGTHELCSRFALLPQLLVAS